MCYLVVDFACGLKCMCNCYLVVLVVICCCFVVIIRRLFYRLELLVMQVAFVRPMLMFIAAVLWANGSYSPGVVGTTHDSHMTSHMTSHMASHLASQSSSH